ncbi:MAG TPA: family 1 glycosylhydrolase [Anaerolineales bacterium]|nr:family 1 glycosylhydrolase [Anaerolineales bacterium]
MPEARFTFPRGFLWGTASSAYQVEGNSKNNQWHLWEQQPDQIADGHHSGRACDWWGGRWREDFDRAAELGNNAIRFSVEWSRVQPAPDRWDESAIDHYIEMLRGLDTRGLFPIVNFHHFTDPLWVDEMGGWENEEVPALFAAYVGKVADAFKNYVTTWCTINEPNVPSVLGYMSGEYPPGRTDLNAGIQVMVNFARGHALGYQKIKEIQPEGRVGFAHAVSGFLPASASPLDKMAANFHHQVWNQFFPEVLKTGKARLLGRRVSIPEAKGTLDYLGLNYYTSELVRFSLRAGVNGMFSRRTFPEDAPLSPNGMIASVPEQLFKLIKWAIQFETPLIVMENGVEDAEDSFRREYLAAHIHQVWRAVNFNYPVKGYFVWSLVDNFEWNWGWTRRFGLYALENETQLRIKRPSADLYAEICKENALSSEMVREYAPGLEKTLFPE